MLKKIILKIIPRITIKRNFTPARIVVDNGGVYFPDNIGLRQAFFSKDELQEEPGARSD